MVTLLHGDYTTLAIFIKSIIVLFPLSCLN